MIKVSVIIPNYNHAAFLQERIDSVLSQTYPPAEIIILDDCSTDESRSVIDQYRQNPLVSNVVYNQTNSGSPFAQWKKGIELAKHDWIWIAESDDTALTGFLEEAEKLLQQHSPAGIFYCDAKIEDGTSPPSKFSDQKNKWFNTIKWSSDYKSDGNAEISECLGLRCTINNVSSTIFKKDLLKNHLDDIATFRFHGDWYAYLAITLKSDIAYSAQALNHYRCYSSGIQSSLPGDGRDREECFRILCFLYPHYDKTLRSKWLSDFVALNLSTGLISGRKAWIRFFNINSKMAFKVLSLLIKNRFRNTKKAVS